MPWSSAQDQALQNAANSEIKIKISLSIHRSHHLASRPPGEQRQDVNFSLMVSLWKRALHFRPATVLDLKTP